MLKIRRVHKDKRGEIYILPIANQDLVFLITNKGYARGGCVHDINDEELLVLKGEIKYVIKGIQRDVVQICSEGMSVTAPKGVPHYFISLTDSVIMEWGATQEEKDKKYKPFRDIVDKINVDKINEENNTTN